MEVKRVPTGISGLDELIGGGFVEGDSILISGGPGTGKTIFAMQYIYKGAELYGEKGIFVTIEERPKKLRRRMREAFGWDIEKYEEEGMIAILDVSAARLGIPTNERYVEFRPFNMDSLLETLRRLVRELNASRVAIDSLSAIGLQYEDEFTIRREILRLASVLGELGVTSVMTTEVPFSDAETRLSKFEVEEFVTDGIIALSLQERRGTQERSLIIRKMRSSEHSMKRHRFDITKEGIVVYKEQMV